MNMVLLWVGVAAFCAAVVALEAHAVRRGAHGPRPARFAFLADRVALALGVLTLVAWLVLSPADPVTAWATGIFWGLAVCALTHLARDNHRADAGAAER
ncbi:hypothetical protein V2W30_38840 [Streptomyces sp. Q6]|uniref:Uncharacterized protein n=1 Tax=Streptomyces citrinus TaxID=3118173 RepID=A0ACD5ANC4_9ACTN